MADDTLEKGEGALALDPDAIQVEHAEEDHAEERFEQRRRRRNDPEKRVLQVLSQRKAAEAERDAAFAENAALRRQLAAASVGRVQTEATHSITAAQAKLKAARFDGDADAEATALSELTDAQVAHRLAAERRSVLEAEDERAKAAPQRSNSLSPEMSDWLGENPWFRSNRTMNSAAMDFHEEALAAGIGAETPEYFAHIDKKMRAMFPDRFDPEDDAEPAEAGQTAKLRQVAPAAPRRASPAARAVPTTVRLSAAQRDAARMSGVTEQAYAAALLRRQQQEKA